MALNSNILDSPLLQHQRPWWQPFLTLFLTLYGILILDWSLQPIVFLFWWEVILMSAAALVRSLFSLEGAPFLAHLWRRTVVALLGAFMFIALIMLSVTFSIKAFDGGMQTEGFAQVPIQMYVFLASYIIGLLFHFFLNKQYQQASPISELMKTFLHLMFVLVLLMVLNMHLIPAYPDMNQAKWVGLAVVLVKFVVDLGFSRPRKSVG